jgi:peptidylprolyl isomerase
MKHAALILILAASTVAASAQTAAKPATAAAKPAAKSAAVTEKLPDGVPEVKGIKKTLYTVALRYQDVKVGDGAEAVPGKLLKYYSTLWVAADGHKLDSTDDHRAPVLDKDKKPVLGDDGKPKLGDPQPAQLVMGQGRPLAGWDLGFEGMKVGGKRRVFIPWQLGLGAREVPARGPNQPAIPAKSDLILDVELVEVADAPQPPARPQMTPGHPMPAGHPAPGAPAAPAASTAPAAPAAPAATTTPKPAAAPAAAPATTPATTPATPATPPAN